MEINMMGACGSRPLVITRFNKTDVTSPGFPNNPYPNNINCTWVIRADVDQRVLLEFVKGHEIEHKYLNIALDIG